MGKILGLDLGTNSIGWAVVERKADDSYSLLHKGVHIFQEGVVTEKGTERPAVQDRTNARASRRHYFRRRLRKIELLKILVREGLCPPLSDEELSLWRKEKKYPMNEEFLSWQRTSDNDDRSPYHDRFVCLNQELDLSLREHRYMLGRALYHLAQRRGFLSSRKDAGGDEDESGLWFGVGFFAGTDDCSFFAFICNFPQKVLLECSQGGPEDSGPPCV